MIPYSIQPYLSQLNELFILHKIESAYIFGSALTEQFNEQSDIDLLVTIQEDLNPVEMGGHLWDLTYELEDIFKRKVDLLTERALKNPYFIKHVNATKFRIYG